MGNLIDVIVLNLDRDRIKTLTKFDFRKPSTVDSTAVILWMKFLAYEIFLVAALVTMDAVCNSLPRVGRENQSYFLR